MLHARGGAESPAEQRSNGVHVHRVRRAAQAAPTSSEFVAWVERMNADMVERRARARRPLRRSTSSTATTGSSPPPASSSRRRFGAPLGRRRSTRPSTAATRAGSTSIRSRTSTASSDGSPNRADAVITCSHYMRDHVADIFGLDDQRVARDPERDRPARPAASSRPTSTRCAPSSPQPHEQLRAAGRPARLREGLPDRAGGAAGRDRAASATSASWSPAPARHESRAAAQARGAGPASSTAPSWAGSATTCCTRSTASPT